MVQVVALACLLLIGGCLSTPRPDVLVYEQPDGQRTVVAQFMKGGLLFGTCFFTFGYKPSTTQYYIKVSLHMDRLTWQEEWLPRDITRVATPIHDISLEVQGDALTLSPLAQTVERTPSGENYSILLSFDATRQVVERFANSERPVVKVRGTRHQRTYDLYDFEQKRVRELLQLIDSGAYLDAQPIRVK